ncbi:hypothetical protein KUCAC02_011800 [Chaenocephalus aceratus]|uniref:Uncharacterized protein n=1 Tax=Chaenocephalus aceratus TaxID=36190 RepID=A0ACB9WYN9_CHAAC|nr:hypothetical protein KUCAC02_011800 [Chaenocephalus aceratus]
MAAREGRAEMEGRLQRARRGMRKVKEDSFTKTSMLLRGEREDGGGAGGFEAATVKSAGVREMGSSSTANPRLRDEVMKTKCLWKNAV